MDIPLVYLGRLFMAGFRFTMIHGVLVLATWGATEAASAKTINRSRGEGDGAGSIEVLLLVAVLAALECCFACRLRRPAFPDLAAYVVLGSVVESFG